MLEELLRLQRLVVSAMPDPPHTVSEPVLPPKPTLLLLYHAEKTGGTTVSHWLARNLRPRHELGRKIGGTLSQRLDGHAIWQGGPCFMCGQFRRELGCKRTCDKYQRDRLMGVARTLAPGGWRSQRLAVEFHAAGP